MFEHWPVPCVDPFASERNHKLLVLFDVPILNILRDKRPNTELDAPLLVCVPTKKSHTKGTEEAATAANSSYILLVGPFWPCQWWFSQLTSLLVDLPWMIPQRDNLKNMVTGMFYPKVN